MSDADDLRTATQNLTNQYLTLFSQQRWDEFMDLWAEDGVLEFPYAPPGRRSRYVGKVEILAYFKPVAGRMKLDSLDYYDVHPMLDPTTVCIEMGLKGRITATGLPIHQRYVSIIRTRDGKITHYREYWNPTASMDANGGREAWTSAFGSPEESAS